MSDLDPIEGNWYLDLDSGQKFEVLVVDDEAGIVEVQYFDGSVDQIDLDAWQEMNLDPIEEPEDWTGPIDDVEPEDLEYSEMGLEEGEEEWSEDSFPTEGDEGSFHEEQE
ncbi:MAG: hypothetical protein N3A55_02220 [Methylohalobius sp.]|nr:hypothetical protein [Methylohalobius sp.]